MFVLVCSVLITWINPGPVNQFVLTLRALSEPAFRPFRRWISPYRYGIDIAPMLAILVLMFLQFAVARNLVLLGKMLGGGTP